MFFNSVKRKKALLFRSLEKSVKKGDLEEGKRFCFEIENLLNKEEDFEARLVLNSYESYILNLNGRL